MGLYENSNGNLSLLAGSTTYADAPIGAIYPYGGSTAPQGFLICDGTAVSRTTYAALFAVIGTSFGTGDGSTTFNVPDLRGKTLTGYNSSETEFNTIGKTGGEKTHKLTVTEMPSHSHMQYYNGGSGTGWPIDFAGIAQNSRSTWGPTSNSAGGDGAHNNLQPYTTVNYIIKATQIALPTDFEDAVDDKIDALPVKANDVHFYSYDNTGLYVVGADGETRAPVKASNIQSSNGYIQTDDEYGLKVVNLAGNNYKAVRCADVYLNGTVSINTFYDGTSSITWVNGAANSNSQTHLYKMGTMCILNACVNTSSLTSAQFMTLPNGYIPRVSGQICVPAVTSTGASYVVWLNSSGGVNFGGEQAFPKTSYVTFTAVYFVS